MNFLKHAHFSHNMEKVNRLFEDSYYALDSVHQNTLIPNSRDSLKYAHIPDLYNVWLQQNKILRTNKSDH